MDVEEKNKSIRLFVCRETKFSFVSQFVSIFKLIFFSLPIFFSLICSIILFFFWLNRLPIVIFFKRWDKQKIVLFLLLPPKENLNNETIIPKRKSYENKNLKKKIKMCMFFVSYLKKKRKNEKLMVDKCTKTKKTEKPKP